YGLPVGRQGTEIDVVCIDQVVDDAHHAADVSRHDVGKALRIVVAAARQGLQLGAHAEGTQRRAQLVRYQAHQRLVLVIGLFQLTPMTLELLRPVRGVFERRVQQSGQSPRTGLDVYGSVSVVNQHTGRGGLGTFDHSPQAGQEL